MSQKLSLLPKLANLNILRRLSTVNSEKLVLIDVDDKTGYGTLSLNRPPANSLNVELKIALKNALQEMEVNKSRGVILTSTSPKIFSAGLDINDLYNPSSSRLAELWSAAQDSILQVLEATFPIAAAVNGHAIGGGCFYAMICDHRSMVKGYKIGLNEIQVGVALPTVLVMLMSKLLPRRYAEISLTQGLLYTADDAQKINLIDEIVADKAEAIRNCEEFLNQMNKIPVDARNKTKRAMRKEEIDFLRNNKAKDIDDFVKSVESAEAQATIKMYFEALKNKKK